MTHANSVWMTRNLFFLSLLFLLSSCSPVQFRKASSEDVSSRDDVVKVLVWNAWRGGNEVDEGPEKILTVIRESQADVVLLQESYDINGDRPLLGAWLAEQLG